jgi:hypothetical protein
MVVRNLVLRITVKIQVEIKPSTVCLKSIFMIVGPEVAVLQQAIAAQPEAPGPAPPLTMPVAALSL